MAVTPRGRSGQLSSRREDRFRRFFERLNVKPIPATSVLVVTHAIPGVVPFLECLADVAKVELVIPKPSSIVARELDRVGSRFPVRCVKRSEIPELVDEIIMGIDDEQRLAILDMGGYFAGAPADNIKLALGARFLGIVEDTENGLRRYQRSSRDYAAISVARSSLKLGEDFVIGEWIVQSADTLLRKYGSTVTSESCAVLGYGRVGSSIAHHLRVRGANVVVFDVLPSRMLAAEAHGFPTASRTEAIAAGQRLFCATGNRSLGWRDLDSMPWGAFVFAATSGDDEFDFAELPITRVEVSVDRRGTETWEMGKARVRFANRGQAVNFMHPGGFAEYVLPVQAELLVGLADLDSRKVSTQSIRIVSTRDRERIASLWLEEFRSHAD